MPKNILVVSPTPTHPQTAGNRARIFKLLSNVSALGCIVYFLHVEKESGDSDAMRDFWGDRYYRYKYRKPKFWVRHLQRKIRKCLKLSGAYDYRIDEWYDVGLDGFINELKIEISFDVVLVEYVFFSRVLECFDEHVHKIIDTHDVFSNRYKHYLAQGERPVWFSTSPREEAKGLNRADVIIAIQENEAKYFSSLTTSRVLTVGHIMEPTVLGKDDIDPNRILLFASNNKINMQATKYFLEDIFPIVKDKISNAKLALAGSICGGVGDYDDVIKLGMVDCLADAYKSAEVVVNPMLFGTGLKIKSLEAMSFGKPLVTTPVGAEGLDKGNGLAFKLAANKREFADQIIKILVDKELAKNLSVEACKFVSSCNEEAVRSLKRALAIKIL